MKDLISLPSVTKIIVGFVFIAVLIIVLPYDAFCSDSLVVKARIPWGWINDFEFYKDGIFIALYDGNGIGYFTVDSSYNLTH